MTRLLLAWLWDRIARWCVPDAALHLSVTPPTTHW